MNGAHVHLMIDHFPIGMVIGTFIFLFGTIWNNNSPVYTLEVNLSRPMTK